MPPAVLRGLENSLGLRAVAAQPLGGGMVCSAARVDTPDGAIFAKWKEAAPARFFACEADGLSRLSAAGGLATPAVLGYHDDEEGGTSWLALEWVETARRPGRAASRRLGEGLAQQHRGTAGATCGLELDNYLGSQPQRNTPTQSWAAFYRDHRIAPQVDAARQRGLLSPAREALLRAAMDRIEDVLSAAPGPPCLVHGDLWSGNVLAAGDTPFVIDPAVYRADREVELAYMELFSGFDPAALDAYRAAYPLDTGYPFRRAMLQLYPLVIHLNHFGETYGPQVDETCRMYAGERNRGTRPAGGA